jgi:hypothetical protein
MNEWVSAEDRLASDADIAACVTLDGPLAPEPGLRYVIGLDIGLKHDRTVAAVCHGETRRNVDDEITGTKVVLDRMNTGGRADPVQLATVEEWLVAAASNYRGATVRLDPWQAIGLLQRLRPRGVQVGVHLQRQQRRTSRLDAAPAAPQPPAGAPRRQRTARRARQRPAARDNPGVVRIDHDLDQHDDRAIALALAASKLLDRPPSSDEAFIGWDLATTSDDVGYGTPGYGSVL